MHAPPYFSDQEIAVLRLNQETVAVVGTALAAVGFLAYLSFATEECMNQRFETVTSRLTTLDAKLESLSARAMQLPLSTASFNGSM